MHVRETKNRIITNDSSRLIEDIIEIAHAVRWP